MPIDEIVRNAVREIGYVNDDDVFHADKIDIQNIITRQSPDIAQGVNARDAEGKGHAEQGAGDQGLMFGFACDETPELMPAPIMFAHRLGRELTRIRKSGKAPWLRPDAKSQVSVIYEGGKPVGVSNVVVSTQHARDVKHSEIRSFIIEEVIRKVLPNEMLTDTTEYLINPTGSFVIGGPEGDTGLTGARSSSTVTAAGAGTAAAHFPVRIQAKSIGARLTWRDGWRKMSSRRVSQRCEIQFAYAIGYPESGEHEHQHFRHQVRARRGNRAGSQSYSSPSSRPKSFEQLDLLRPIYSKTTNYGHFGKDDPEITWERTDKAAALKKAAN